MKISHTYDAPSDQGIDVLPTSYGQQRLWFLHQLEPQSAAYNISANMYLNLALDVAALEKSLNVLIERHEVLRTTFVAIDGLPMQVIAHSFRLPLPLVDLSGLSESQQKAEALRLANHEVQHPFDLAQGPLIRARLLKQGAEKYILLLTIHHIIFDEWSMNVFYHELATLYEAFSSGKPSSLSDLPIQYADFAIWQQEDLQGEMLDEHLAYWKRQLTGAPTTVNLPVDRHRSAVLTSSGAMYFATLPKDLVEKLKALSHQEGVTLYMTLVAAFQTLLQRYTNQDDLMSGTFAVGRTQIETEALIGFFTNTLVLRTDLSGNPPFRDLLSRVRETVLEAYAHQEAPFEYLVKELQPERNMSQNPLFQVLLSLDPPLPTLSSNWIPAPLAIQTGTTKFDLSLGLAERSWGMTCRFEYRTDLFDEVTIALMAGHWQMLLESIVANPSKPLAELPLLRETERHQLLVEWNATQTAYPKDRCIHQLFEEQVEQTPDATAVVCEDKYLTYRELNARANQVAHYLQQLDVGPEVLVGICVERSLDMLVGLFGILKAGGAYVPLDPTYPADRLAFMVEDAKVSVLVIQQHLRENLPAPGAKFVCLDADRVVLSQQREVNPAPVVTSNNLAYVIYTSGSTGQPKGVQISHRAVVNLLTSMRQQPGLLAEDTLLAVTTLSFDIAYLELFLPLTVGARLVVASRDVTTDGQALAELLTRSQATIMQATPITWHMLLAAGWQGSYRLKILCGGEALPLELMKQLLPKAASLWNLYGPTETTIWSAACQIKPEDEVVTIGHPIANTEMYILDRQLQLVPTGVPGELYIGGDGLARDYLNRPELTAVGFIRHPFSAEPGARLYKTGDLARYRADGTIEVLGRLDQQVKLRGFRIELGEIEAVLSQHPAVRQAVVMAREDVPDDKRLVAYLVTQEPPPTISELRSFLKEQLPEYMLPSAFVFLEALPLTPNGKVDRRVLPAPGPTKSTTADTFVAPTLAVHYQLLQIWEELFYIRPIGIRDNFFDLGGYSFLATRLVNRIEQVFRKKISLATLFAGPTIEHLADALQQQEEGSGSWSPLVMVQTGGSRRPFFFLHGDYGDGGYYCFPLARNLGPDQPFYALEPYSFDILGVPPTLEAMAAAHLKSLRSVQAEGPYLLGGYCNGGLVAYEMARQLHAEGETVDLLVLVDPGPLVYPVHLRLLRSVISRFGNLMGLGRDKQLDWLLGLLHVYGYLRHAYRYLRYSRYRKLKDSERWSYLGVKKFTELLLGTPKQIEPGHRRGKVDFAFPRLDSESLLHDYLIYHWVALGYMPPDLYPSKITFFWTSGESFWRSWTIGASSRRGWRKVEEANGVEVHILPGEHTSTLTKHLHVLAAQLRQCLDKAQAAKFQ